MSRTSDWVIAEQERIDRQYSAADIDGWMLDSASLHHAMLALRQIASGDADPVALARQVIAEIEPDPKWQPGHEHAAEVEHQQHVNDVMF